MLKVASALLSGFRVKGFAPALLGAILLSLVHLALRWLL